jgi:anti-sigma regulatory factor (Ser/Thr protein kinase)
MTAQWAGRATGETVGTAGHDWLWSALEHAEPFDRSRRGYSMKSGLANESAVTETCALPPEPESVKVARDFTRTTLRGWGMPALFSDMGLVVSELVTNALHHATPACSYRDPNSPIRLSLIRRDIEVICAVRDSGTNVPFRKEPQHVAETGRGLLLVESFSCAWGWTPLRDNGKVVWALFNSAD